MEATDDVVRLEPLSGYWHRLPPLLPGIWASLAVSVAAFCTGWGEEQVFGRPIVEPLVLAILFGMLVRAVGWVGSRQESGIRFVAKDVLEVAVCLLGATMDVPRLFASGPALALGIVVVVVIALSGGYLVGRVIGLSPKLAVLVACGNAICGNSAIAAVAPVIGADREDVAASIALTAVLGVIAVLGLPLLMPLLGYTNYQYGVLAGLTVYAVPQVLAAAFAVSVLSGQVATVVKLARVLMLGPVVLFFSLRAGASSDGPVVRRGALVPWFVAGFVVLAALRSFGVVPDAAANASKVVAAWLTIAAMAALGLASDLRSVRRVGTRVMLAVGGSLSVLMVLAVSLIRVLRIH
ncbi:MAG TPA: putative sulfate exporter family transporter [Gemmatimonadaceae bacterium]|nr:putative sulfate exporter family transporter [Gemmatimonadaceae bacterium]